MAHGHDVLHMMEGNTYTTKEDLVKAIIARFGTEERFHTCSAEVWMLMRLLISWQSVASLPWFKEVSQLIQVKFATIKIKDY